VMLLLTEKAGCQLLRCAEWKFIGELGSEYPERSRSASRQACEQYAPSALCLSQKRQKS